MGDGDGLGMHSAGGSGHSVPSRPMKCPDETVLSTGRVMLGPRLRLGAGQSVALGPQFGGFAMSSGAGGHAGAALDRSFSARRRLAMSRIFSMMLFRAAV